MYCSSIWHSVHWWRSWKNVSMVLEVFVSKSVGTVCIFPPGGSSGAMEQHACGGGAESPDTTDGAGSYHDTGGQQQLMATDDTTTSGSCQQQSSPGSPSSVVCTMCGRGCGCQQKQTMDVENAIGGVYQRQRSSSLQQDCCTVGVGNSSWDCGGGSVAVKLETLNSAGSSVSFDTADCQQCVMSLPSSPSAFLTSSSHLHQLQQSESGSSESLLSDTRTGNNWNVSNSLLFTVTIAEESAFYCVSNFFLVIEL